MRRKFGASALVVTATFCFALLGGTAAAQITVGQIAPTSPTESFCSGSWDELQLGVSSGASYAVPAPGGVLTSWSTNAGPGPGQKLTMKVFRPAGPETFSVVGQDGPRSLTPSVLNTFTLGSPIAVSPGDIVGIHLVAGSTEVACEFETTSPLDTAGWREGDHPVGTSFTLENTGNEFRYNIAASLLPPPTIGGLGTTSGPIAGGTSVVITGANFAAVRGVSFGTTAATFSVNSEGQITATAPPSVTIASVPVSVTTAAGSASSASTFTYEGCVVPKLAHKKLKAAKKAVKKGDCKVGKVTKKHGVTAKTGKVVKQNPKPGKVLAPGTQVSIKLG